MKVTLNFSWETSLRWFLGLIVIWAALSKLANLQDFYGALLSYHLPFPNWFARIVVRVLPWLELLCGACLMTGYRMRPALVWSLLLFSVFVFATGQAWWRGLDISCGCLDLGMIGIPADSSIARSLSSPSFAFFRAIVLLAATIQVWRLHDHGSVTRPSPDCAVA